MEWVTSLAGEVTSFVVEKLSFFPPWPTYDLLADEATGRLRLFPFRRRENVDVLKLPTRVGTEIVAVYVRCPNARSTVLYSHGNAMDIGQIYEYVFIKLSTQLGVNLLGYDYSGYGRSTGKPSEQNTYADIEAAYKCLEDRYGAKQEDIILYGQSVGCGPTIELAARLPRLRALVLQSPLLSALRKLPLVRRTYSFDIYANIDKIHLVKCPVLVIHGTKDNVANFSDGKQLYELCQEKFEPLWIEGGGHNDLGEYPVLIEHLKKFLSAVEKPPSRRNTSASSSRN